MDKFLPNMKSAVTWRSLSKWDKVSWHPILELSSIFDQKPQICTGDLKTCIIYVPAWGSNWGFLGFSRNQNSRGSSGGYVTCIYCGLRVKIHALNASWCAKIVDKFVLRLFLHVWSAKTWRPHFEPHGWRRHCTGWYTRSGISRVYLCQKHTFSVTKQHRSLIYRIQLLL